jgi:hypothetical protein
MISMDTLVHRCARHRAGAIGAFYRLVLGCDAQTRDGRCVVTFGGGGLPEQRLVFEEADVDATEGVLPEHRTYHVCIYLRSTEQFERAFRNAEAAGLVYVNSRFEGGPLEFASARTWAEARQCGQFRVNRLSDPSTGQLGAVLEHEIRSPMHTSNPALRGALSRL